MCEDAMYMTNSKGNIGEHCGVPTCTRETVLDNPWKGRGQVLWERDEPIDETM